MICAWNEFLSILPPWLRREIDTLENRDLQELRLRMNSPPELKKSKGSVWLNRLASSEDITFIMNLASRYSPWAVETMAQGFITAPGGHRIGICGEAIIKEKTVRGLREIRSICIRIARDFPGIGRNAYLIGKSMLILGAPGWGKTTLLRDIARTLSEQHTVCVLDERKELFPVGIAAGKKMDILYSCPKAEGIEMLLRSMGPDYIAVDEITAENDANSLIRAAGCGVHLLATAHASSLSDLQKRPIYRSLLEQKVFDHFLVLRKDKTFSVEGAAL